MIQSILKNLKIPEVVRVGNNRTGMLKIARTNVDIKAVINLYTVQNILGKHIEKKSDYVSHLVLQYYLMGYYTKDEVVRAYDD
ncbi:hypothetical protein [Acidiplasma cupricumulans]|uniref:hypothetical protein n=1 Tax=Acidiplasma cupricumulans TaxID=312540 RepID=UPI000A5BCCC8|nr:hypothetical protein [Acidiplasma cupricumulans]